MADTATFAPEFEEHTDAVADKAGQLAEMIAAAQGSVVFFLGAGVSVSAGVPCFRGPEGLWTLQAQKKLHKKGTTTSMGSAVPTISHRVIKALLDAGLARHVITQNLDSLERRADVCGEQLSELHGNRNMERCPACDAVYLREYRTRNQLDVHVHTTGRICRCGTELEDTTINFDENLHGATLDKAEREAASAQLVVVLGSSLTVTPAADIPLLCKPGGGRLVIVNLQETPLDGDADLRVFGKTDAVMARVAHVLGVDVPSWTLTRYLTLRHGWSRKAKAMRLCVRAHDRQGIPLTMSRHVDVKVCHPSARRRFFVRARAEPFNHDFEEATSRALQSEPVDVQVRMVVYGNYGEGDVVVKATLPAVGGTRGARTRVQTWKLVWQPHVSSGKCARRRKGGRWSVSLCSAGGE